MTPQPESSSVEWWEEEPFSFLEETEGRLYAEYDIPAILKEQRRLVLEEVRNGLYCIANGFGPVSEAHLHDEIERFREKVDDMLKSL